MCLSVYIGKIANHESSLEKLERYGFRILENIMKINSNINQIKIYVMFSTI